MDPRQAEHLSPAQGQAIDAILSVENSLVTVIRSGTVTGSADKHVRDLREVIDAVISSVIRNPKR